MHAGLGDRFAVGVLLGQGSAAEVYRATDRATGRDVAVKLAAPRLAPEVARWRFEREAAALSVLSSPHVVRLIDAGAADDGRPYLVLELLIGRTLEDELGAGPPPPADVVAYLQQTAAALELAHGLGIVHRDLKPANVFLHDGDGRRVVKVLDFGLVKEAADGVRSDGVVGTPLYMAPEQVRGQATRIGPASDGWALGMLAVTLLTGETYWAATSAGEVIAQIDVAPMYAPSTRWPWLPPAFDRWFARATHRVAERRYRSVAEQIAALERALAGVDGAGRRRTARGTGSLGEASTMMRTPTPSIVRLTATGPRPLVGRVAERAALDAELAPGAVVTLVGPPGVGKTRLAEAIATDAGDRFVDGAWVVPLGGAREPAAIAEAIVHALGHAPDATAGPIDQAAAALAGHRALIVLDGADHVAGAADVIAALRARCPEPTWLVTSRVPLGVPWERRLTLAPLELPAGRVSAAEAASYAAIELLVRRVGDLVIDDDNADDLVAIARLVDGLPLGLELAAAQLRARGAAEVRAHLERAGSTLGDPVRAAVAWSHDLLAPDQQAILRHLAVLPAGLTFADVRARLGHLSADVAGAVMRLLESGLAAWSSDDPPRLTMLDSVRELCRRAAQDRGEEGAVWAAALAHLEDVVARGEAGLRGADQEAWLGRLDAEHDNLRAAIARALLTEPAAALRLTGRLAWYWYVRGHYEEGSTLLEAALTRAPADAHPDRLRALHAAGRLALLECSYDRAAELLGEARALAAALGDRRGEAEAAQVLGSVARERGDYATSLRLHRRALALWLQEGDAREAARARNYLVFASWLGDEQGAPGAELAAWAQGDAEAALRALGDVEGTVWALLNRGAIAHHAGDAAAARAALEGGFAEAASSGFQEGIAWALDLTARASLARGDLLQARAQLHASLRVHRRLGDLWRCASVLDALAAVLVADGRPARGAVYLGAADALRARIGTPVPASERALRVRCEADGAAAIGEAFAAGRTRGRRTPLDEIVGMAAELLG